MPDRLVICLDGTWNSTFTPVERENGTNVLKPTNPLKVARAVLPIDHNGNRQITYYDSGVGALGIYPGLATGFSIWSIVDWAAALVLVLKGMSSKPSTLLH